MAQCIGFSNPLTPHPRPSCSLLAVVCVHGVSQTSPRQKFRGMMASSWTSGLAWTSVRHERCIVLQESWDPRACSAQSPNPTPDSDPFTCLNSEGTPLPARRWPRQDLVWKTGAPDRQHYPPTASTHADPRASLHRFALWLRKTLSHPKLWCPPTGTTNVRARHLNDSWLRVCGYSCRGTSHQPLPGQWAPVAAPRVRPWTSF